MIQNYSKIELGELLSNPDEIIARNAMSILKRLQARDFKAGVKAELICSDCGLSGHLSVVCRIQH